MTEISRRLKSGEPNILDPQLRSRILASVSYTDEPEMTLPKRANWRSGFSTLLMAGGAAAGIIVIALMNTNSTRSEHFKVPAVSSPSASISSKVQQPGAKVGSENNAAQRSTDFEDGHVKSPSAADSAFKSAPLPGVVESPVKEENDKINSAASQAQSSIQESGANAERRRRSEESSIMRRHKLGGTQPEDISRPGASSRSQVDAMGGPPASQAIEESKAMGGRAAKPQTKTLKTARRRAKGTSLQRPATMKSK